MLMQDNPLIAEKKEALQMFASPDVALLSQIQPSREQLWHRSLRHKAPAFLGSCNSVQKAL